jgi:hypothetical protein
MRRYSRYRAPIGLYMASVREADVSGGSRRAEQLTLAAASLVRRDDFSIIGGQESRRADKRPQSADVRV